MIWLNGIAPSEPERYQDWQEKARRVPEPAQLTQDIAAKLLSDVSATDLANLDSGSLTSSGASLNSDEQWSPVLVKVWDRNKTADSGVLHENLFWLRDVVQGRLPKPADFNPIMSPDDLKELDKYIYEFKPIDGEPVAVGPSELPELLIYLARKELLENGGYRTFEFMEIIHAGAPIPDFKRNLQPELREESFSTPEPPIVIGVIDDGIAFAHERFGGRVKRVWLQEVESVDGVSGSRFQSGRELLEEDLEEINKEIEQNYGSLADENDVYRHPKVGQIDFGQESHPSIAFRVSHGTHVMDLAAGASSDPDEFQPVILAVQLPPNVTEDTSGMKLHYYVWRGLRKIISWAEDFGENVPLVVNFSYGVTAGPKDGTQFLEAQIDQKIAERCAKGAPTAAVLPAGNGFESRTVAYAELDDGDVEELDWFVLPDDYTENFLEIWVDLEGEATGSPDGSPPLEISLTPPGKTDTSPPSHELGKLSCLSFEDRYIAGVYCDRIVKGGGAPTTRYRYFLTINRTRDQSGHIQAAPAGPWRLTLKKSPGTEGVCKARLYIQRDDTPMGYRRRGRQSYFDHDNAYERDERSGDYRSLGSHNNPCPISGRDTLNAIGTGAAVVIAGGLVGESECRPADYSASGPARTKDRPDLSALSDESDVMQGVLAAGSRSGSSVAMRGTSVAAPQVTRWIAKLMAQKKWTGSFADVDLDALLASDTFAGYGVMGTKLTSNDLRLGNGKVSLEKGSEPMRRYRD